MNILYKLYFNWSYTHSRRESNEWSSKEFDYVRSRLSDSLFSRLCQCLMLNLTISIIKILTEYNQYCEIPPYQHIWVWRIISKVLLEDMALLTLLDVVSVVDDD